MMIFESRDGGRILLDLLARRKHDEAAEVQEWEHERREIQQQRLMLDARSRELKMKIDRAKGNTSRDSRQTRPQARNTRNGHQPGSVRARCPYGRNCRFGNFCMYAYHN